MQTWIKLLDSLHEDPRVFTMAELLAASAAPYILTAPAKDLFGPVTDTVTRNALRDITIAGLSRIWRGANHHTTDGVFRANLSYLDTLAQIPGIGAAMVAVGWASHDPAAGTVTLPNFSEHNQPDKNGHRSTTANAERQKRHREKLKALAEAAQSQAQKQAPITAPVTLPVTPPESKSNVTNNASSSVSDSDSLSESKTSESEPEVTPVTPLDQLEGMKVKINALSPRWKKFPRWNDAEEHILLANLPNLLAAEEQDFAMIAYWLRWAASPANTNAKEPVAVTASRAAIAERFPDYLERATRHWKQTGSPRLNPDGSKASAKVLPFKQPEEPTAPPSPNENAFLGLLAANGGAVPQHLQQPPTVATKPA